MSAARRGSSGSRCSTVADTPNTRATAERRRRKMRRCSGNEERQYFFSFCRSLRLSSTRKAIGSLVPGGGVGRSVRSPGKGDGPPGATVEREAEAEEEEESPSSEGLELLRSNGRPTRASIAAAREGAECRQLQRIGRQMLLLPPQVH